MIVGVPAERLEGELRVALVPGNVPHLVEKGLEVRVERGAGQAAGCSDASYQKAGAELVEDPGDLLPGADLVVKVQPPSLEEIAQLREGSILVCVLDPYFHADRVRALAERKVSALALDLMPRTTLAQSMDVLSSQSTLAGYRAVILAAERLRKVMPLLMTAAGTLRPARVLVIGAGVAGLQAIATARRLGAVVEAFDIRAAAKEQVESLGARFVEDEAPAEDAETEGGYARAQTEEERARSQALLARRCADADCVISTALVPGREAPRLITREMVESMRPGSVIVDLAAERGGNCELSVAGQTVDCGGVQIVGAHDLASRVPVHASQMFSHNVESYLLYLLRSGELALDRSDEHVSGPLVTHAGEIVHEGVARAAEV
ncbi:MAG: Re/Si-specific NAD(P)(+) transhydrogenase subunit alpha [Myxococcota bacterium]